MLQSVHAKRVDNGNMNCVKFNTVCCLESALLEDSHRQDDKTHTHTVNLQCPLAYYLTGELK